jgi:hypothetical protein
MKSKTQPATFHRHAAEVREIAKGIFDHGERRVVLRLVAEYVKLSRAARPKL